MRCRKCGKEDNLYFDNRCLSCWVEFGEDKISLTLNELGDKNE